MTPELIGILGIILLLVFIFTGVYICLAMAIIGFVGSWLVAGSFSAMTSLVIVPFGFLKDSNYAVMPLFMLMSEFISLAGIGRDAYTAARAWVGHIRGGLAMATIGGCGLFAATSGSSTACAVVMGKVAFPEMMRFKYSMQLAAGVIAAGGTIGVMIPPSMPFVMYGILTGTSIGKLFIAGILPGITQIIFYWITIYILCRINPSLGPASVKFTYKERAKSFTLTWPIFLLFLIVMGGIYTGVFTASEAAAIGAFGALLIGVGRKEITTSSAWQSLNNTVRTGGMLLLMLVGAFILNNFMAVSRMPFVAADWLVGLQVHPMLILAAILVVYIILGCFFEMIAVQILTIPIMFPAILALGFDPIWYGVLMCRMSEMGFITPPFGLNLFVLNGVLKIPMSTLMKGVVPFIIADLLHTILLAAVPAISLFLPNIMR
jgi:C4-dicarboxylate transporter, DctM subunit